MNFWVCMGSEIMRVTVLNLSCYMSNKTLNQLLTTTMDEVGDFVRKLLNIFPCWVHIFIIFAELLLCVLSSWVVSPTLMVCLLYFCCRNCLPGGCLQCQEKMCSCWRQWSQSSIYNCTWTWAQVRICISISFFTDATVSYLHLKAYKWSFLCDMLVMIL